jgi:plasmid stabilization system protein ParE
VPYELRTARRAEADIDAAVAWISRRSPIAAAHWHDGLQTIVRSLETNPERCPLADEALDLGIELRELPYGRRRSVYRILFTIAGQTVNVLRIRHAAQDRLSADDI